MIHPSYTELMAVINSEVEEGEQPLVQSRYSIVKATANRAKEIIDQSVLLQLGSKLTVSPIFLAALTAISIILRQL